MTIICLLIIFTFSIVTGENTDIIVTHRGLGNWPNVRGKMTISPFEAKADEDPISPSCLRGNVTWDQDKATDTILNVESPEECQNQCQFSNCSSFTWVTGTSSILHNLCILFSNTDQEIPCEIPCVSGPPTCLCSTLGECEMMEDNLVGTFNAPDEETCYNYCLLESSCSFYNFYYEDHPLRHLCILFSSCEVVDETCNGCIYGHQDCNTCDFDNMVDGQCIVKCQAGWTEYEDSCYKLLTDQTAKSVYEFLCKAAGGDLVSIHSEEENIFLVSLLRSNSETYFTWIGGECYGSTCAWSDGSNWDWEHFGQGEPDYNGNVILSDNWDGNPPGLWYDETYDEYENTHALCKMGK